jgi:hypothetical protein
MRIRKAPTAAQTPRVNGQASSGHSRGSNWSFSAFAHATTRAVSTIDPHIIPPLGMAIWAMSYVHSGITQPEHTCDMVIALNLLLSGMAYSVARLLPMRRQPQALTAGDQLFEGGVQTHFPPDAIEGIAHSTDPF